MVLGILQMRKKKYWTLSSWIEIFSGKLIVKFLICRCSKIWILFVFSICVHKMLQVVESKHKISPDYFSAGCMHFVYLYGTVYLWRG